MQRHTDFEITEHNIESIASDADLFVEVIRDFDHFMELLETFLPHAKLLIKAYYITGIYVKKFLDAKTTKEALEDAIDGFADGHDINIDKMVEEEFTPAERRLYNHYLGAADIHRLALGLDKLEPLQMYSHFGNMEEFSFGVCSTCEEVDDSERVDELGAGLQDQLSSKYVYGVDTDLQSQLSTLLYPKFVLDRLVFLKLLYNNKEKRGLQMIETNMAYNLASCIAAMPLFENEIIKQTVLLLCAMDDKNDCGKLKTLINQAKQFTEQYGRFAVQLSGNQSILNDLDNQITPINYYRDFDANNSSMHAYRKYKRIIAMLKEFMTQLIDLRKNALVLGNRFVLGNAYVAMHNPNNDICVKPVKRNDYVGADLPIDVVKKIVIESRGPGISEALATQWTHRFFAKKIQRINGAPINDARTSAAAAAPAPSSAPTTPAASTPATPKRN